MPRQVVSIQYLRAVAALMVVLFHMGHPLARFGYSGEWPESLSYGVDIFFVVSGFVMWITTADREVTPAEFFWRRFARIVPLYWILTGISVIILLVAASVVKSGRYDGYHMLASFLFIPSVHPVTQGIEPVVIPGWTLNYEMFFYAMVGAVLVLPLKWRLSTLCGLLCAIVLVCAAAATPSGNVLVRFYGSSIMLEFGFGLLLGAVFQHGWAVPARWCWLLLGLGFAALAGADVTDWPRALVAGVPALAIVAGAVFLERAQGGVREVPALHLLGDASYSLYLFHGMVLSAVEQLARKAGLAGVPGGNVIFVVLAFTAAVMGAIALYILVERPLTRQLVSLGRRRMRPLIPAFSPILAKRPLTAMTAGAPAAPHHAGRAQAGGQSR